MLAPSSDHRARIDGSELERLAVDLLIEAGQGLTGFRVGRREVVKTPDGQYQIDEQPDSGRSTLTFSLSSNARTM